MTEPEKDNAQEQEMKIDPTRATALSSALKAVAQRISAASGGRNVRLVAVSKLKPASDIQALYNEGHRHFGENYAQELIEKAEMLPGDIRWHFIGGLQSNKCRPLTSSIRNLHLVSSIDSSKKATQLSKGRAELSPPPTTPLNIHIQINTSGESSKSGVSPGEETTSLALHIINTCPELRLVGLMTIGAIARSKAAGEGGENEDFGILRGERDRLEKELRGMGVEGWGVGGEGEGEGRLELSMGMSDDFEKAVEMGSDEVRVGSTIFGTRPKREDFVVKGDVEEAKH